jgi:glycosyltransferase involved in cell wall biosynthesis
VTTPCGGQSDYIEEGRNGFLVEPGEIANLTDRLHRLLSNYEFCRQRGKDGWEQDRSLFRTDLMAEKFRHLYRDIHRQTGSRD